MTFQIITKWGYSTFRAKCGKVSASSTASHEWAARAVARKLITECMASGRMINPAVDSLVDESHPTEFYGGDFVSILSQPRQWKLDLREAN